MEANILGMEREVTVERAKTSAERHVGCVRLAWCLPSIKRRRQTMSGEHEAIGSRWHRLCQTGSVLDSEGHISAVMISLTGSCFLKGTGDILVPCTFGLIEEPAVLARSEQLPFSAVCLCSSWPLGRKCSTSTVEVDGVAMFHLLFN